MVLDDELRQVGPIAIGLRPAERRAAIKSPPGSSSAARLRQLPQHRQRFGMRGAEELGHEVVDVHPDAHRPGDRGALHPLRAQRRRQRRRLDVAGVPVPGAAAAILRIEDQVVDDAVDGRFDAGDERRVRRERHRRHDADDAAGRDAVGGKLPQLRRRRFGRRVAHRHQAVDRDHHDAWRGWPLSRGDDQAERANDCCDRECAPHVRSLPWPRTGSGGRETSSGWCRTRRSSDRRSGRRSSSC